MIRVLVVSDSHGNQQQLFRAEAAAGPIDLLIHLGDGEADCNLLADAGLYPVVRLAGNCDLGSSAPRELIYEVDGVRLLLCHGDRYQVKNSLERLTIRARELQVQAALYGHTHLAQQQETDGILLLNPGTLWGRAPFLSYALLTIDSGRLSAEIQILPE